MNEITVDQLKSMLDKKEDLFILDVRQKSERAFGKIEPDTPIPLHELANKIDSIPKNKKVIVYCRSGNRSNMATAFLKKNGIDASNLKGGILAWKKYDPRVVDY